MGEKVSGRKTDGSDDRSAKKPRKSIETGANNISEASDQVLEASRSIQRIYDELKIDGYEVSREHRAKLKKNKEFDKLESLTYGEVDVRSFVELLTEMKQFLSKDPESFVDIGAGTCKPIFLAPIVFPSLTESIGYEIVPSLCDQAALVKAKIASESESTSPTKFEIICKDSFAPEEVDRWTSKDLIFLPATCFTDELMEKVHENLGKIKKGSLIIITTRKLIHARIRQLLEKRCKYAKGTLLFRVYKAI